VRLAASVEVPGGVDIVAELAAAPVPGVALLRSMDPGSRVIVDGFDVGSLLGVDGTDYDRFYADDMTPTGATVRAVRLTMILEIGRDAPGHRAMEG
jgi:hypothetical protein